jgi:Exopolysaccharide synthesis, ExoD
MQNHLTGCVHRELHGGTRREPHRIANVLGNRDLPLAGERCGHGVSLSITLVEDGNTGLTSAAMGSLLMGFERQRGKPVAHRWHWSDVAVPIPAWLAAVQRWATRWLRPRWILLLAPATHRAWGCWIGALGVLLLLPLPLANVLPAMSLALLSLAWEARDGLALAVFAALGGAGLGYALLMSHLLLCMAHEGLVWLRSTMARLEAS